MKTTMTSFQLQKLLEIAEKQGMTVAQMDDLLKSGVLNDVFHPEADYGDRQAMRQALKLRQIIEVNFHLNLTQMVAAGHYDKVNDHITANLFKPTGTGKMIYEFKLFDFNKELAFDQAWRLISEDAETKPWSPANIEHLLSFGAFQPEEQWKFRIIALGSGAEIGKEQVVPGLDRVVSARLLDLYRRNSGFVRTDHFLAVRPFL